MNLRQWFTLLPGLELIAGLQMPVPAAAQAESATRG